MELTQDNLFNSIKRTLVEKSGFSEEDISLEANLSNDLNLDSLDVVELSMDIEAEYDISIPDSALEDGSHQTVSSLIDNIINSQR